MNRHHTSLDVSRPTSQHRSTNGFQRITSTSPSLVSTTEESFGPRREDSCTLGSSPVTGRKVEVNRGNEDSPEDLVDGRSRTQDGRGEVLEWLR